MNTYIIDKLIAENEEIKKENAALKLLLEWAEETGFGYDNIPEEYAEFKDDLEKNDIGYMEGFIYMAKKRIEQGYKAWFDKGGASNV